MLRCITILFLLCYLPMHAQVTELSPQSILEKMHQLRQLSNLDSTRTDIAFFKNPFGKLDSTKQFYVYRDTIFHSEGKHSIGYCIIDPFMEGNGVPIGEWSTYFDNGQLYSKGTFKIGAYTVCEAGGPKAYYYPYRWGNWSYWYDNGQILGKGDFPVQWKAFNDTCGEDRFVQPRTTKDWKFYKENGLPAQNNKDLVELVNEDHL